MAWLVHVLRERACVRRLLIRTPSTVLLQVEVVPVSVERGDRTRMLVNVLQRFRLLAPFRLRIVLHQKLSVVVS